MENQFKVGAVVYRWEIYGIASAHSFHLDCCRIDRLSDKSPYTFFTEPLFKTRRGTIAFNQLTSPHFPTSYMAWEHAAKDFIANQDPADAVTLAQLEKLRDQYISLHINDLIEQIDVREFELAHLLDLQKLHS